MKHSGSRWTLLLLSTALATAAIAENPADPVVLEGFEVESSVQSVGEKPRYISDARAVTEGKVAAELPPGTAARVNISDEQRQANEWLLIDTFCPDDSGHMVSLTLYVGGLPTTIPAVVQKGRDTLALPLNWAVARSPRASIVKTIHVLIRNDQPTPLVLDNIRMAPAMAAPKDAVLVDFGPAGQGAWPGFAAGSETHPAVGWSGQHTLTARTMPYVDPLGSDWVGPGPRAKVDETVTLNWGGDVPGYAWAWFTHYASYGGTQGEGFSIKDGKQVLAQRKLTGRDALGPHGLMEGDKGKWTPEWFTKEYVPHFVERVSLPLKPGGNKLDLQNCQLAAVAMFPQNQKLAAMQYMKTLEHDLARFHRQFILGRRMDPKSAVPPTEEEARAGFQIFGSPGLQVLLPLWRPADAHRLETLKVQVAAGQRSVSVLAVVPLKDHTLLRAQLMPLRTATGKTLALRGDDMSIRFIDPVADVRGAMAQMRPWLPSDRANQVKALDVVPVMLEIHVPQMTEAGVYTGALRILGTSGVTAVPLEVEVFALGTLGTPPPLIANSTDLRSQLPSLFASATGPQIRRYNEMLLQDLLKTGFTSATLAGPAPDHTDKQYADILTEDGHPAVAAQYVAASLVDLGGAFWHLNRSGAPINSAVYRDKLTAAAALAAKVVGKLRVNDLFGVIPAWSAEDAETLGVRAAIVKPQLAACGQTYGSRLTGMAPAKLKQTLDPLAALAIYPNAEGMRDLVVGFKALGGTRKALLFLGEIDRYRAGLYAAAVGADGVVVRDPVGSQGPYKGFNVEASAVLTLMPDAKFAQTIQAPILRQAQADLQLVQRCQALVAEAERRKVAAGALNEVLLELSMLGNMAPAYEGQGGEGVVTEARIEELRGRLLLAGSDLARQLGR